MSEKPHKGKNTIWWKKFSNTREEKDLDSDDLTTAILTGNPDELTAILQAGINPDLADDLGRLPLHFAAEKDRDLLISIMLEHEANLHILDSLGNTALMTAAKFGSVKAARRLLHSGLNYFLINNLGKTALDIALEYENNWICDLFLLKEKELTLIIAKERNLQGALYSRNALKVLYLNARMVRERLQSAGFSELELQIKESSLPELELELRRLSTLLDEKGIVRN